MTGAIVANRKIGRSIVLFLRTFRPERTLDYGCGKGLQWTKHKLHEEAGVADANFIRSRSRRYR